VSKPVHSLSKKKVIIQLVRGRKEDGRGGPTNRNRSLKRRITTNTISTPKHRGSRCSVVEEKRKGETGIRTCGLGRSEEMPWVGRANKKADMKEGYRPSAQRWWERKKKREWCEREKSKRGGSWVDYIGPALRVGIRSQGTTVVSPGNKVLLPMPRRNGTRDSRGGEKRPGCLRRRPWWTMEQRYSVLAPRASTRRWGIVCQEPSRWVLRIRCFWPDAGMESFVIQVLLI
jgi:hypothetical protein